MSEKREEYAVVSYKFGSEPAHELRFPTVAEARAFASEVRKRGSDAIVLGPLGRAPTPHETERNVG